MKVAGREWNPDREVLLADGAWGTEFLKLGLAFGDPPEEWNLSQSNKVLQIAQNYVNAGSNLVLTNTFGANRYQLERHGLADKVREINRRGAEISVDAAGGRASVVGDIGPSGKLLVMGEVSEDEIYEVYAEQARALKEGGAEFIVVETMTDKSEMSIAVKAAVNETGIPVIASMTYEQDPKGYRTVMGNSPEDCIAEAEKAGAAIIGANCGSGVDTYVDLATELNAASEKPVWIKANAGLPEVVDGITKYRMTAADYGKHAEKVLMAGANIIGGCCGTSPEYIRVMREIIDNWNEKHA